jgi:uncharacterized membrane protein YkoI
LLASFLVALVALVAVSAQAQKPAEKMSKKEQALRAEAKVSEDAARATALATVPHSTVKESELEKENGKLIWSFDLKVKDQKGIEEVHVDAMTGKVVGREHETKKQMKKEKKADKKEHKKELKADSIAAKKP